MRVDVAYDLANSLNRIGWLDAGVIGLLTVSLGGLE